MLQTQKIEYHDQDVLLEGYVAWNNEGDSKKPAILIAHDWSGRNDFACEKAEWLAGAGYVGFALDMFGKGKLGHDNAEKAALIKPLLENRNRLLNRMLAAFETVKKLDCVNTAKIGAIGFCFGGLCVLDLARANVGVSGVVSFHGLLNAPENSAPKPVQTKILALHGHDDPMVPPETVLAFETEMTKAGADWQVHVFGNTQHAFTNPKAHDSQLGTVYNALANKRAMVMMKSFFEEVLG